MAASQQSYFDGTFYEWCCYYYGETSDVTGVLPLMWWDKYQPIEDEE